jgi:hypothetical protein
LKLQDFRKDGLVVSSGRGRRRGLIVGNLRNPFGNGIVVDTGSCTDDKTISN